MNITVPITEVQRRLERACLRAGRDPAEVKLIAVTKGQAVTSVEKNVLAAGHTVLGESRIQEWRKKAAELEPKNEAESTGGKNIEWHLIGNLQTNKVKYCLPFHTLHTLNSERLADALEAYGARKDHTFRVLLEVNVAGEANKQGVSLEEAAALARYAESLPHLELAGVMTIAPYHDDSETSRPIFRALRKLRDKLSLGELSMGMSGDFEVAVEEGATYVRVGSALFPDAEEAR